MAFPEQTQTLDLQLREITDLRLVAIAGQVVQVVGRFVEIVIELNAATDTQLEGDAAFVFPVVVVRIGGAADKEALSGGEAGLYAGRHADARTGLEILVEDVLDARLIKWGR